MSQNPNSPSVAVVMPVYDGAHFLPRSLVAILEAAEAGGGARVLVVDAGSTDDTGEVATRLGAEVLRLPERHGPAGARNVGVRALEADVMLFVDADCVAHPDVVSRVRTAFGNDPELVSLCGSYDDAPAERSFFSDYMNLRHRFFHQHARRTGATFWAGCGAVRRDAFLEVGGFDADRYPLPQIEDIELGVRLQRIGPTALDPELNVKHLKRWSLRSVVETDIRCRAIPWTDLILETGEMPDDLNLGWSQRVAAALAPLALLAPPIALWAALAGRPVVLALAALALATSLALHVDLIRHFAALRGPWFAAGAWLFHQVHLSYSVAAMALTTLGHYARGRTAS